MTEDNIVNSLLAIWAAFVGGCFGYLFTHRDVAHQFLGGVFQIM